VKSLFIICAGGSAAEHYRDTLENGANLDTVIEYLPNDVNQLEEMYPNRKAKVWGANIGPSNESKWDRLNEDTIFLVYHNGKYVAKGRFGFKVKNEKLATRLWRTRNGDTWELVYFIKDYQEIDLSKNKLNKALGYKPNFSPQGSTFVFQSKVEKLLSEYGTIDEAIDSLVGKPPTQDQITSYFIFKTKEGSVWEKDVEGETYHYAMGIPGSRQIHEGDYFVYYREKVFFGTGQVGEIEKTEIDGKTESLAQILDYRKFNNEVDSSEIDVRITQPGIQRIGKDTFDAILAKGLGEDVEMVFDGFTEEDFERCTGEREDARYVWEKLKQFKEAIIPELNGRLEDFVWKKNRQESPYVAQWFKQKSGGGITPRDHFWLGMSHRVFDNPRAGIQFQFGIGQEGLFAMGLWIEAGTAQSEKEKASSIIREDPDRFLEFLKPLFPDFKMCFHSANGERTFFDEEADMSLIIEMMGDNENHFVIMRDLSKDDVIDLGQGIITETAESFQRLIPLYDFFLGQTGELIDRFYSYVRSQGFDFSRNIIANYYTSLKTKPFVILTGISGTGKTKLAQLFAEFMAGTDQDQESVKRHAFISVRPDWTDSKGLLGFYNAILARYEPTETLKLLIRAHKEYWRTIQLTPEAGTFKTDNTNELWDGATAKICIHRQESGTKEERVTKLTLESRKAIIKGLDPKSLGVGDKVIANVPNREAHPFFVILDEMNLAKVEYYFSDFLSTLESRRIRNGVLCQEPVILHDRSEDESFTDVDGQDYEIPPRLEVPPNVYFTGTVNIDETTYMFSPKVLDRANTIEFNDVDLEHYGTILEDRRNSSPDQSQKILASIEDIQSFTSNGKFVEKLIGKDFGVNASYFSELKELSELLEAHNLHFGYRVVDEILCYLDNAKTVELMGPDLSKAFDLQILQKILPKFHGSRNQLERPLAKLLRFCLDGMIFPIEQATEIFPENLEKTIEIDGESLTYKAQGSSVETEPLMAKYPRSSKKLLRMLRKLREQGFVSFIE